VPEAFEEGQALWQAVCEHELEGVVAKRLHVRYRPSERWWLKVKNRPYRRYELEREKAISSRRHKWQRPDETEAETPRSLRRG
jgi:ATP-dependent DNA ligase